MLEIFGRPNCAWCDRAKELAAIQKAPFIYRDFTKDPGTLAELKRRAPGARTVPQIFIGERLIGGYTELAALITDGKLNAALEQANGEYQGKNH